MLFTKIKTKNFDTHKIKKKKFSYCIKKSLITKSKKKFLGFKPGLKTGTKPGLNPHTFINEYIHTFINEYIHTFIKKYFSLKNRNKKFCYSQNQKKKFQLLN